MHTQDNTSVTSLLNLLPVDIGPVLCDGCRPISPSVDHQVGGDVLYEVSPPSWEVQDLPLLQDKRDGCGLGIEGVFGEVWGAQAAQGTAPLQGAFLYCVVQVLVVCG